MKALLAAAALVAIGPAATGAEAGAAAHVLVVPADDVHTRAPFVSEPGTTYELVVDGRYWYGDGAGLADACHYTMPDGSAAPHAGLSRLRLDYARLACTPSDTHRYVFRARGTGRPFVFDVLDPVRSDDNVGGFVVRITALRP